MANIAPMTIFMGKRGKMRGKRAGDNEAAETAPDNERAEGEKPARKKKRVASVLARYARK